MPELLERPVSWFKKDKNQPRKSFNEADDRALGESMKAHGQLQPVGAKPEGTLLWGERRLRAALLAGIPTLWVIIAEKMLTDSEIRIIQLIENLHRSSLSGYDRWQACEELKAMNPDWMAKDLAEHLKLDPSMIVRLLSPSLCSQEIRDALKAGKISLSDCYAMSKSKSPVGQAKLLALKLTTGASRDKIEAQARKQRSGTPAVVVSRIKCPLPSGAVIQVSGQKLGLDDVIEAISELLKDAKRASEQGWDVKTFERVCKDRAKAK